MGGGVSGKNKTTLGGFWEKITLKLVDGISFNFQGNLALYWRRRQNNF